MRSSKKGLADLKQVYKEIQAEKQKQAAIEPSVVGPDKKAQQTSDLKMFARVTQSVTPLNVEARKLHKPAQQQSDLLVNRRKRAIGESAKTSTQVKPSIAISDGAIAIMSRIDATEDSVAFAAPGVGPDISRKLKQAYWPVGAELDLHGLNAEQARTSVANFIEHSRDFGTRCVRIVHGKGYGSKQGQPVLRQLVTHWLTQINAVQAFTAAPASHGGAGALLVLIRLP